MNKDLIGNDNRPSQICIDLGIDELDGDETRGLKVPLEAIKKHRKKSGKTPVKRA